MDRALENPFKPREGVIFLRALHTCEIAQDRRTNFVKSKFLIDIIISSMNIKFRLTF